MHNYIWTRGSIYSAFVFCIISAALFLVVDIISIEDPNRINLISAKKHHHLRIRRFDPYNNRSRFPWIGQEQTQLRHLARPTSASPNLAAFNSSNAFNYSAISHADFRIPVKFNQSVDIIKCKPASKIAFLKTHKTGSSTVSTILDRYGYNRNLSFIIGPSLSLSSTKKFHRAMKRRIYPNINGKYDEYNILSSHVRYNRKEIDAVLGYPVHFTILRHPVSQFESVFIYFRADNFLSLKNKQNAQPLDIFLKAPEFFYYNAKMRPSAWFLLRNGQMFDLGLDHEHHDNESAVQAKIQSLSQELDLVMITEYFDESIVLLSKLLCWNLDDLVYIPARVRKNSYRLNISEQNKARILEWNQVDLQIYQHFNRTLWRKISDYGPEFSADLQKYRNKLKIVKEKCLTRSLETNVQGQHIKEDRFLVKENSSSFCKEMWNDDRKYHKLQILKQRPKLRKRRGSRSRRVIFSRNGSADSLGKNPDESNILESNNNRANKSDYSVVKRRRQRRRTPRKSSNSSVNLKIKNQFERRSSAYLKRQMARLNSLFEIESENSKDTRPI